ncbi:MAG: S1C family serine protease, partial [Bdellovibrionaceae bacterium]|nr:S1C family serine protease [Pseudobdellovibrionaceae bacterium]
GELRYGPYAVIHMSSPINSGMSGGPTVNSRAEIIGVNVSKNAYSDSLSFAVPARFARNLLDQAQDRPSPTSEKLIAEIGDQLRQVQDELTNDFLAAAKRSNPFGAWTFTQPSPIMKCWSQKDTDDGNGKFDSIRQNCQVPHSSYIDGRLHSGTYSLEVDAINGRQLKPLPFYTLLNSRFDGGVQLDGFLIGGDSSPALLTRQFCFSRIVANQAGLKFKIAYCSRGYVKFDGLRDASISLATIAGPPHGLLMQVDLRGFSSANIKKILDSTINSIRTATK